MSRFIIISTCYNKGEWVQRCVSSLKAQSNQNFKAYFGYDESPDDTLEHLKYAIKDHTDQYTILYNKGEKSFLGNFTHIYDHLIANSLIDDEDVVVELDGDDWLLHSFVLDRVAKEYQNPNIAMTYGQYIEFPKGNVGGHFNMHLDDQVDAANSYRKHPFPYSHLRTYKAWLLAKLTKDDLTDPSTGELFKAAGDFALCMPMVELVGKSRIARINEPLYVLNRDEDLNNESKDMLQEQKSCDLAIRKLPPRRRIKHDNTHNPYVTTLIGSCDSYSPLWKNFDILYKRYSELNTENLLVSETIKSTESPFINEYTVLTDGVGLSWGERMLRALDRVTTPYVFFILDDYYFTQSLSKEFLKTSLDLMNKHKADKLLFDILYPMYSVTELESGSVYKFNMDSEYLNSIQPGFWKVDYLKKVLQPEYSPWDFEVKGNELAATKDGTILLKRLDPPNDTNDVETKKKLYRFYHNFVRVGGVISEGWEDLYAKEGLE